MEKRSGFYLCTYSTSQSVIDWLFSMEVVIWWTLITYSTTAWNSTERKIIFCLTSEVYSWRIAGTQWQCALAWNDQVNVMEYLTLHMLCKHLFWVLDHNPPSLRKDKLFLQPIKSRSDFERSFVEWGYWKTLPATAHHQDLHMKVSLMQFKCYSSHLHLMEGVAPICQIFQKFI